MASAQADQSGTVQIRIDRSTTVQSKAVHHALAAGLLSCPALLNLKAEQALAPGVVFAAGLRISLGQRKMNLKIVRLKL